MAINIYHILGVPTLQNLNIIISRNIVQNFLLMVKYVEIAENIFGNDVSIFKGRTTRKTSKVVADNFIKIPRELIDNNQ